MLSPRLAACSFLLLLLTESSFSQCAPGQHPEQFVATVTRQVRLRYLLFLPESYSDGQSKRWPLILYLNGGSRRGTDLEKLREPGFGLTALVEKDKSFPFIGGGCCNFQLGINERYDRILDGLYEVLCSCHTIAAIEATNSYDPAAIVLL
ncbi:MAG TPA: hypothetical protein VE242_12480 [Chthoniobacterales bacterium]|nr:hypothetical protein [Chthoniobacterales bacterium]